MPVVESGLIKDAVIALVMSSVCTLAGTRTTSVYAGLITVGLLTESSAGCSDSVTCTTNSTAVLNAGNTSTFLSTTSRLFDEVGFDFTDLAARGNRAVLGA